MFTVPRESGHDESLGFPSALRTPVRAAVAVVADNEIAAPHDALDNAQGIDRRILACLGTRHHDGYVRQACRAQILDSGAAWLMPYIVQLAGET